ALQVFKIPEQANGIKLLAGHRNADLVIVPVGVFTLAPVPPQGVSSGKALFYTHFKHAASVSLFPSASIVTPAPILSRLRQHLSKSAAVRKRLVLVIPTRSGRIPIVPIIFKCHTAEE